MIKVTPDLWVSLAPPGLKETRETSVLRVPRDPWGRKETEDCGALRGCPGYRGEMAVLAWRGKLVKRDQKVREGGREGYYLKQIVLPLKNSLVLSLSVQHYANIKKITLIYYAVVAPHKAK